MLEVPMSGRGRDRLVGIPDFVNESDMLTKA